MQVEYNKKHKIINTPPRSKYPPELTNYFACPNKRRKLLSHIFLIIGNGTPLIAAILFKTVPAAHGWFVARRSPTIGASLSAINRSGDVERMNFSSWSSSCSFWIAGATPNTTLGNAASTSRAISSVSLKWCQYTIWSFGRWTTSPASSNPTTIWRSSN